MNILNYLYVNNENSSGLTNFQSSPLSWISHLVNTVIAYIHTTVGCFVNHSNFINADKFKYNTCQCWQSSCIEVPAGTAWKLVKADELPLKVCQPWQTFICASKHYHLGCFVSPSSSSVLMKYKLHGFQSSHCICLVTVVQQWHI